MSEQTTTPPRLPAKPPAAPVAQPQPTHRPRMSRELPHFLKFVGIAVGGLGALGGFMAMMGEKNSFPGIAIILGSLMFGVASYALSDIVLSLRIVAWNTTRP